MIRDPKIGSIDLFSNFSQILFLLVLLEKTPPPGFEPGQAEANWVSSPAQYQVMRWRHRIATNMPPFKTFSCKAI